MTKQTIQFLSQCLLPSSQSTKHHRAMQEATFNDEPSLSFSLLVTLPPDIRGLFSIGAQDPLSQECVPYLYFLLSTTKQFFSPLFRILSGGG